MPDTPIPPEAVEAAARAQLDYEMTRDGIYDGRTVEAWRTFWDSSASRDERVGMTAALTAALPFLPQHVSPSAEEIAQHLRAVAVEQVRRETREQVAREIEADVRRRASLSGQGQYGSGFIAAMGVAARIARAAEAVDR